MKVGDLAMYYDGHIPYAEPVLIVDIEEGAGREILALTHTGQHWVDEDCLCTMEEWERIK